MPNIDLYKIGSQLNPKNSKTLVSSNRIYSVCLDFLSFPPVLFTCLSEPFTFCPTGVLFTEAAPLAACLGVDSCLGVAAAACFAVCLGVDSCLGVAAACFAACLGVAVICLGVAPFCIVAALGVTARAGLCAFPVLKGATWAPVKGADGDDKDCLFRLLPAPPLPLPAPAS